MLRSTVYAGLITSALALASCQSTRPAYLFQPSATGAAATVVPVRSSAPPEPQAPATIPARQEVTAAHLGQSEPLAPARQSVRARLTHREVLRQPVVAWQRTVRPAAQAARNVTRPRHSKEVGLGTTVLGVLGLIVLPIALLGLLIWGGPVWAILAGLAAVAVLVAYLDPFG
ncbi:hypothetical protein SAMN06265337_3593 [Hymenobacter gelipurpurascens]|uniref:Uncharacterized protein n=2 Tax=Hymenobacter gelipurpurascens TaxID=89968 RepID=A0A212UF30_9BACT|nr:hypothetical protein SAMN06265337_3593 [Hymenobacter gelipurpurascens]